MRCQRSNTFALALITIGFIFLMQNTGVMEDAFTKLWPLLLVVIGIYKIIEGINEGNCKHKK